MALAGFSKSTGSCHISKDEDRQFAAAVIDPLAAELLTPVLHFPKQSLRSVVRDYDLRFGRRRYILINLFALMCGLRTFGIEFSGKRLIYWSLLVA